MFRKNKDISMCETESVVESSNFENIISDIRENIEALKFQIMMYQKIYQNEADASCGSIQRYQIQFTPELYALRQTLSILNGILYKYEERGNL